MEPKRTAHVLASLALAFSLLGCAALTPTSPANQASPARSGGMELKARYAGLGETGGKVFSLNPARSAIRIHVFRGGRVARLGHNHVLSAPRFTGYFYLPTAGAANGRFDLEFRLDQLEIDKPAYRAGLGDAFSSILSPEDIDGGRKHTHGNDNLQADKFPLLRIHSLRIAGESPKFAAKVRIEMHGREQEMWLPLDVAGLPDALTVSGALILRQTDFGVQPYSALGGLVAVQDEVVIEFRLVGRQEDSVNERVPP